MCTLLKFDSAKFGVSKLCLSKVIKEKPLRSRLDPLPFGKGRVKGLFHLARFSYSKGSRSSAVIDKNQTDFEFFNLTKNSAKCLWYEIVVRS